jgi:hypothetical protein
MGIGLIRTFGRLLLSGRRIPENGFAADGKIEVASEARFGEARLCPIT